MVVGCSGRRHSALGQARDCQLLHPLRGEAQKLRSKISLPAGRELRGDAGQSRNRGHHQHDAERRASGDHLRCARAGKHVFLDKPIANTVSDGRTITEVCHGLRLLKRGESAPVAVSCTKNDTLVEELEEFAAAARGERQHEVGGEYATISLAVVRAGILSAREGRPVEVAELLESDRRL
jgi:hypothetical protein